MTELSLFEKATRQAIRFQFKGSIGVEDLWNLKLEDLNAIAVELHKQVQESSAVSFIEQPPKASSDLQLKLEVAKRIIAVKLEERNAAAAEAAARARRQQILALLNEKELEQMKGKSIEELKAELAELQ